jgi:NADPH-dependent curcumin reductase CurA
VEARAVGQVVQSAADGWAEGDWVLCWGGWRDYAVVDASKAIRIQPRRGLPHTWLHVLGVPGLTAYIGLVEVARLQPGDRVWVSAAAGAVGSVAAQLARARGASLVIGSAGGAGKARYLSSTLGLDAAVDYRAGHLAEQMRSVAPEGVDLYFDNVGGDHLEAAIDLLRTGGRAAICGMISGHAKPPGPGPGNLVPHPAPAPTGPSGSAPRPGARTPSRRPRPPLRGSAGQVPRSLASCHPRPIGSSRYRCRNA